MYKGNDILKKISLVISYICILVIVLIPILKEYKEEDDKAMPSSSVVSRDINLRQSDGTFPGLDNPTSVDNKATNWLGSKIYLGNYSGTPLLWRVLSIDTTDYNLEDEKTVLLQSDTLIGTSRQFGASMDWSTSTIREYLNGTVDGSFYSDSFTLMEKKLITESTKSEITSGYMPPSIEAIELFYTPLSADKIFLLDISEVNNAAYGYANNNTRKYTKDATIANDAWWLRSTGADNKVAYVNSNGEYETSASTNSKGIMPAMNISLDDVLFTSRSGYKNTASLNNGVGEQTLKEWKLTVKDPKQKIEVVGDVIRDNFDDDNLEGTITLNYKYTKNTEDNSLNANSLSVMITDKEDTIIQRYSIVSTDVNVTDGVLNETGTVTFRVHNNFKTYANKIYIIAEQINEGGELDYASEPVEVHVPNRVIVNGDWSRMDRDETSGAYKQSGSYGDITPVIYKVKEGYYIPLKYNGSTIDGINITRKSKTEIVVSGNPTNDTTIYLKDCVPIKMIPTKEINEVKTMNIGASNLYTYDVANKTDKTWDKINGNKVYYGKYGATSTSVLYRVLEADVTGLLLDCDTTLFNMAYNSTIEANVEQLTGNANEWKGSNLSTYLNSENFVDNQSYFSSIESKQILNNRTIYAFDYNTNTYKINDATTAITSTHKDYTVYNRIFLLGAMEAYKYYGGGSDSASAARIKTGTATTGAWWLSSSNTTDGTKASYVGGIDDGAIYDDKIVTDTEVGVSPAFKIEAKKILYTTSQKPTGEGLQAISSHTGDKEWKFTLVDDGYEFRKRKQDKITFTKNGDNTYNLSFTYKYFYSGTNTPTQISAMITNGDRMSAGSTILYYGKVAEAPTQIDEKINITIPSDFDPINHKIYVFPEDINAGNETDYAALPYEVCVPVEGREDFNIVYSNGKFYENDTDGKDITSWCEEKGLTVSAPEGAVATITMDNFNFVTSGNGSLVNEHNGTALSLYEDAIIQFKGNNTIKLEGEAYLENHYSYGIKGMGNLTLEGDGILNVYCEGRNGNAINVTDDKTLTINSGTINAYGGKSGNRLRSENDDYGMACIAISAGYGNSTTADSQIIINGGTVKAISEGVSTFEELYRGKGIYCRGNITINDGIVHAVGGGIEGVGIDSDRYLIINNGTITAKGGNDIYDDYTYCAGIVASRGMTINGGEVTTLKRDEAEITNTCVGNGIIVYKGVLHITEQNENVPTKVTAHAYGKNGIGIHVGPLIYDGGFNRTINGYTYFAGAFLMEAGIVKSYGGTKDWTCAIRTYEDMEMQGGELYAYAPEGVYHDKTKLVNGNGMYVYDLDMVGGKVEAYGYGQNGHGICATDDVEIADGNVKAYAAWNTKGDNGFSSGIYAKDDIEIESGSVIVPLQDNIAITGRLDAIHSGDDFYINGTEDGETTSGNAYVEGHSYGSGCYTISASEEFIIYKGTVKSYSGTKGKTSAIRSGENLEIRGGNILATYSDKFVNGGLNRVKGLNASKDMIISGGNIEAHGIGTGGNAICADKDLRISGGNIIAETDVGSNITIKATNKMYVTDGTLEAYGAPTNNTSTITDVFATTIYGEMGVYLEGGKVYAYRPKATYDKTIVRGYGIFSYRKMEINNDVYIESYGYGLDGKGIFTYPYHEVNNSALEIAGGTINAYGGEYGDKCAGLYAGNGYYSLGTINILGGDIYAVAPYVPVGDSFAKDTANLPSGCRGKGIVSNKSLSIIGGNIEAYGYGKKAKGIDVDQVISISGGTIKAYGGTGGEYCEGIESEGTIDITGGHIYAGPIVDNVTETDIVSGYGIFAENVFNVSGIDTIIDVYMYGTKAYGLKSDTALNINGGKINVYSKSQNTSNKHYGIEAVGNVSINAGTIDIDINSNGEGIWGIGHEGTTGTEFVSVTGGNVNISMNSTTAMDYYNAGVVTNELSVTGGSIVCRSTGAYVRGIYIKKSISVMAGQVKCQGTNGGIECADEVTEITLDTADYTNGDYSKTCVLVASVNYDGSDAIDPTTFEFNAIESYRYIIIGSLYDSSIKYNAENNLMYNANDNTPLDTGTLTLMGIKIIPAVEDGQDDVIELNGLCITDSTLNTFEIVGGDVVIRTVEGTKNSIINTSSYNGVEEPIGIYTSGSITFEGEGELEVSCTGVSNTFTEAIVANGRVSIIGGTYYISADSTAINVGANAELYIANSTVKLEVFSSGYSTKPAVICGEGSTVDVHANVKVKNRSSSELETIIDYEDTYRNYYYVEMIPSVISVDINWGNLQYELKQIWQTDLLEYKYVWSVVNETDNKISVTNNTTSNVPIHAKLSFEKDFDTIIGVLENSEKDMIIGETFTSTLVMSGILPESFVDGSRIGQVSVTLTD